MQAVGTDQPGTVTLLRSAGIASPAVPEGLGMACFISQNRRPRMCAATDASSDAR